jgi:hypothetical protein
MSTDNQPANSPQPDAPEVSTPKLQSSPVKDERVLEPDAPEVSTPKLHSLPAEDERVLAEAAHSEAEAAAIALTCPVCGLVNRPGELACSRCGTILAPGGTTRKLGADEEPPKQTAWPTGDVIVTEQEPIILDIDGQQVSVPVAEVVTIGRVSDVHDDSRPDVDLGPFGAGDKGVSRKHVKIKRKNILVYVADLGSTNGTLLNGRRLIPNAERLLRNGDELQLGRLKVKVKF